MIKHCKYSKTKEVKPYQVLVICHRYDGDFVDYYYFKNEVKATLFIEDMKRLEPQPNEYYFGTEYKINYIGTEKYI